MSRKTFALCVGLALVAASAGVGRAADRHNELDMTGARELKMLHCPLVAPGARTIVKHTADGVVLLVTASNEFGQREIRRRAAAQQASAAEPARTRGRDEHTGRGTGSARYGYCPGIMANTNYVARDIRGGVRIVVAARRPADVAELQRSTDARAAKLRARMQTATR